MWPKVIIIILHLCLFTLSHGSCPENDGYDDALVIALLALHHGDRCEQVVQKGAQQIAALESELNKINSEYGNNLKLDLKVFDTCSTPDEAVKATLKAMVYKEQVCQKPPLFLGFLGPDEQNSLRSVTKVSGVFKLTHVVPSYPRNFGQYNALNVEMVDPTERAKALKLLLNKLTWTSFIMVHTSDEVMTQTASALLTIDNFCITESVIQIPSATTGKVDNVPFGKLLHSIQQNENSAVVVLSDTAESVKSLLQYLKVIPSTARFMIYVQNVGVVPWSLPQRLTNNVILLQETTNSAMIPPSFNHYLENTTLWTSYLDQLEAECTGCPRTPVLLDNSLPPLIYSLHLYMTALKTAYNNKCNSGAHGDKPVICHQLLNINPDEWRTILESTVAYAHDAEGDAHKIRFHMDLENVINVLVFNPSVNMFDDAGYIRNGKYLNLKNLDLLPKDTTHRASDCYNPVKFVPQRPKFIDTNTEDNEDESSTTSTEDDVTDTDEFFLFGFNFSTLSFGDYEIYVVLGGVALGVILLLLVISCCVYRCFRVKDKKRSRYSDNSSVEGSIAPPPKKKDKHKSKNKNKNRKASVRSDLS